MSGNPPPYGFPSYFPGGQVPPGAPTQFPSFPGAPPTQYQSGAPPTQFASAPPSYFPGAMTTPGMPGAPGAPPSYFPPQPGYTSTNYFPTGETHFTSASAAPALSQAPAQSFPGGSWVQWFSGSAVPANAVQGGRDMGGETIYVGRVRYKGDLIPAKVIPQRGGVYVSYDGEEHSFNGGEILCQQFVSWVSQSNGSVPPRAVHVGSTAEGEPLYAGRVHHEGTITVGKVHPSHGCCYISFAGREIPYKFYEVLTA